MFEEIIFYSMNCTELYDIALYIENVQKQNQLDELITFPKEIFI